MGADIEYTASELLICALAREVKDGELVCMGLGTHLPTAAMFLAKATHAPDCCFLYSTGGTFSYRYGSLGLTSFEGLALRMPMRLVSYGEIVTDTLIRMPFKEFSRPAQVDGFGNTNNILIGDISHPKLRLPGAGGIPDFSGYATHDSLLYVPRHNTMTFVEKLDFRSGVGRLQGQSDAERERRGVTGRGSYRVITDLGIIDFTNDGPIVSSLHPGTDFETIAVATGFSLQLAPDVCSTPAPTAEQLGLIREEIDPLGLRELELVPSAERTGVVRDILRREAAVLI